MMTGDSSIALEPAPSKPPKEPASEDLPPELQGLLAALGGSEDPEMLADFK